MAHLALLLEDRRDVLRERHRLVRGRRGARRLPRRAWRRQRPMRRRATRESDGDGDPRNASSRTLLGAPDAQRVTVTFTNPFVQQHCACPAPATPDASFARTRTM